jgi:DNA adenine methylase
MLRSPIRWVGGKSRIRKTLIALLPPHDCYVEVFGGAGWLLFAKKPSRVEVLNDIDDELMNFFDVVRSQPDELLAQFRFELVSRQRFERLRDLSTSHIRGMSCVQRAHRFYYLIMGAWGGEFGKPRFQTSVNDNGHGNRLAGALKDLHIRLTPVHKRLQTVLIESSDWRKCIDRYDDSRTVMYLDPPYPGNACHYVHNMREWDEHEELLETLRGVRAKFILSGYDSPRFRKLCRGLKVFSLEYWSGMPTAARGTKGRQRNAEVLVTNFDARRSRSCDKLNTSSRKVRRA